MLPSKEISIANSSKPTVTVATQLRKMKMLSVPSQLLEAYPSHCKYTRKRTIRSTLLFDATIVDLEMHQGTPCHHHQWPLPRVAVLLLASWHFHHQHALALGAEEATHHGRTVQGMLIPKTPEKKKKKTKLWLCSIPARTTLAANAENLILTHL